MNLFPTTRNSVIFRRESLTRARLLPSLLPVKERMSPPRTTLAKRLFVKTYGCQMNVYDSARMADVLAPLGYASADSAEDADMVILNTCHSRVRCALMERFPESKYSRLLRRRLAVRAVNNH